MTIVVIVNPASGFWKGARRARARARLAAETLTAAGHEVETFLTERRGHARELAARAADRGRDVVCVWGGDGTVNEVGSALAGTTTALAIVPGGSGNGLAHALGMPFDPRQALARIDGGRTRRIDAGELAGRPFFNLAGLGFDAHVAGHFDRMGRLRGPVPYVLLIARDLARFQPERVSIAVGGVTETHDVFLLAFGNGRQYGNGAIIAPKAELDDGQLDMVRVTGASLPRMLLEVPRLFTGSTDRSPLVRTRRIVEAEIRTDHPIVIHLDGEPEVAGSTVIARVRPAALLVRA